MGTRYFREVSEGEFRLRRKRAISDFKTEKPEVVHTLFLVSLLLRAGASAIAW